MFILWYQDLGPTAGFISTCHNWLGDSFKMRFYAILDKNILKYCNQVIGVSNDVVNEIVKHVPIERVAKIENGVDINKYIRVKDKCSAKRDLGLEDKTLIGFVGRLSEEKGLSI
jgi:glycosyltransferase involved in cell wall biosynthesis